jgi:hypothetical protein
LGKTHVGFVPGTYDGNKDEHVFEEDHKAAAIVPCVVEESFPPTLMNEVPAERCSWMRLDPKRKLRHPSSGKPVFRWLRILALTTLIMVEEVIKSIHIIE